MKNAYTKFLHWEEFYMSSGTHSLKAAFMSVTASHTMVEEPIDKRVKDNSPAQVEHNPFAFQNYYFKRLTFFRSVVHKRHKEVNIHVINNAPACNHSV